MEEELLYRAIEMKKKSEEAEKSLEFVSEQIAELGNFSKNLELLENEKEKEMLSHLGRGVFMKTDRKEDKFFIDVGAGVFLRKTNKETREVIAKQITKFNEAKVQIIAELESYAEQFKEMMGEFEKIKNAK